MVPDLQSTTHCYCIFNTIVESELSFPGMPGSEDQDADIFVRFCPDRTFRDIDFHWFHEWTSATGVISIQGARHEDGFVLRFPGLADFEISADLNVISIVPGKEAEPVTLGHLLFDQVIPRILNQLGKMVLHASAVELAGGRCVAFVGNTGMGKSTLAGSFLQDGCRLLADDSLLISFGVDGVKAIPAYSSIRLWPDSADSLFPALTDFKSVTGYGNKVQRVMAVDDFAGRSITLAALFILDDPEAISNGEEVCILPALTAREGIAVIESLFVLTIDNPETQKRNFRLAMKLANSALPVYRLSYQRRFENLPRVREAITRAVHHVSDQ